MSKFIYSVCSEDDWPTIKSIISRTYKEACEKLIDNFSTELENGEIEDSCNDITDLQDFLNLKYRIVLSDLYDIEEL